MFSRLADLFLLQPTRHAIDPQEKSRRRIDFAGGHLEVWAHVRTDTERQPDIFILKLPGMGGRAERSSEHPAEVWQDAHTEVWALNPPGYGGSSGRASVQHLASAALAAFDEMQRIAHGRPVLVTGNSLGAAVALHVAVERRVAGLILRNPPPLREVILERFGWWNLWLGASLIARQVPNDLDGISNAAKAQAPAVFVHSARDRVVPPHLQQRIIESYAGQKRVLLLADAGHADPIEEHRRDEYFELLHWLRDQAHAQTAETCCGAD